MAVLKNGISSQLADIFNISFSAGVFPTILKVAKVVPDIKKTQNWTFQTIDQFHYYPVMNKYSKKLIYNRVHASLHRVYISSLKITSFMHCNLGLDNSIPPFMP